MNQLHQSYCTLESVDKAVLDDAVESTYVLLDTLLEKISLFHTNSDSNST
jgi:hypothetical protein